MSAHCCDHTHERSAAAANSPTYRRVLWVALALNIAMFFVEIGAGLAAQSASLLADSLDFLGDAGNYGLSLFVLGMALHWRARASLLKAASMGAFGLWVAATTIQHALAGTVPEAPVMGVVGTLAFAVNLGVAALLYRWREGDSNMRCRVDLHAQRCDRQPRGAGRGGGRVRLGHRLARLRRRRDHVGPGAGRRFPGGAPGDGRIDHHATGVVSRIASCGPRASRPLMIMSGRDARGPEN